MAGERTIKVKFVGDASGLQRSVRDGQKAVTGWRDTAKGVAVGFAGLQLGKEVLQFGKDSVHAFAEAEEAQTKLADAFTRFPKLSDTNIESLRNLNTELSKKTRFDDDSFAAGQAVLAQFKLTGKQIEDVTPLLADYAAKTGQSIPEAASTLGRAFLGQTRALKAVGINYKSTGDQAKDAANITALLRKQVGGFAEKEGQTASGKAQILSNRFGEIKEAIGGKLLPVLMTLADVGLKVVDFIGQNIDVLGPLIGVIGAVVAVQWAWNAAMAANPVSLIVIAIAGLVAGIVLLWKKSEGFRNFWKTTWSIISSTFMTIKDGIVTGITAIGTVVSNIADGFKNAFKAAFNFIADIWNNSVGKLQFDIPSWVPFIGGNHFGVPLIPKFHGGGVLNGGAAEQAVMLRRGEGVFTPEQMAAMGNGTAEIHIHIGDEVTRVVQVQLNNWSRGIRRGVTAGAGAR